LYSRYDSELLFHLLRKELHYTQKYSLDHSYIGFTHKLILQWCSSLLERRSSVLCWCPEHVRIERESEGPMRPYRRVATAGATPSWQIWAPSPRTRAPPVRSRRPQRGGCRTSLDLFHVVQLFSYLKEYYSVVWWNNNWKNLFLVFFSQSSNRTFSQSHWFSFLKALYIMMKEPGLINLQPHYCIITCYLNCCSKLHYCIMPIKENKLQGTKYTVFQ